MMFEEALPEMRKGNPFWFEETYFTVVDGYLVDQYGRKRTIDRYHLSEDKWLPCAKCVVTLKRIPTEEELVRIDISPEEFVEIFSGELFKEGVVSNMHEIFVDGVLVSYKDPKDSTDLPTWYTVNYD